MIKVAIVDSGVNIYHPAFKNEQVFGYSLQVGSSGEINKDDLFDDSVGHGTAVFYLIRKLTYEYSDKIAIDNVKIYSEDNQIDQLAFEKILKYIGENNEYDVVNISMGITNCANTEKMQQCIDLMHNRGTIIVAAFDNNGAVSFPAALEHVIGVDGDGSIGKLFDFCNVENSIVNIIGKKQNLKVAWTTPLYNIVKGNSYTCCFVTASIINQIVKTGGFNEKLLTSKTITFQQPIKKMVPFEFGRMAIFPLNKEMQTLLVNEDLLNGTLSHCYSSKFFHNVGMTIHSCFDFIDSNRVIENIDLINWDDLDTIVLGHLGRLSSVSKKDYKTKLILAATERGKQVFAFDEISDSIWDNNTIKAKQLVYYPHIDSKSLRHRFGKMYSINKPILCVSGTSSAQGKFTLQLFIRRKLIEAGYIVGQIGTEPSSYLFGFDECFPCGYMSTVQLNNSDTFSAVNQMLWDIAQKKCDIILAGTQSGLVPYSNQNINLFPFPHQLFFEALQPDLIILCFNPYDSVEFITRNIKFAEAVSFGKVIGLVCYPLDYDLSWRGNFGRKKRITPEKESELRNKIYDALKLKVYMLDKKEELCELINSALSYLSRQ